MNFFTKLKGLFFDLFVAVKNGNYEKVEPEVQKQRVMTCAGCTLKAGLEKINGKLSIEGEKGIFDSGNCKICGCFVNEKTKYKDESCPLNKW